MGYRLLFMILAFIIIIGSITAYLGNKHLTTIDELSSSKLKKEAQQLANSYVLDTLRDLKRFLANEPGAVKPDTLYVNQGGYKISLKVHDSYPVGDNKLDSDQYYIMCRVVATADDSTKYRFGTNALYQHEIPSSNIPTHWIPSLSDPLDNNGFPLSLGLQYSLLSFWQQQSGSVSDDYFTHYPPQGNALKLQGSRYDSYFDGVIYITSDLVPEGFVRIANQATPPSGSSPLPLSYDITVIVEGDIRIDGAILVNPPYKINLVSVGGTIYTASNANPSRDIQADLYKAPAASAINIGAGYTHDPPYRKLETSATTFAGIWTDLYNNGSVATGSPGIPSALKAWEELPGERLP